MGVDEGPRVVQSEGDDVQHERDMDGPVDAVAINVNPRHNDITQ